MDGKISIIIPVYNAEKTLERCITSLMGQTYENIEIILVNDGSQDHSLQICHHFAAQDNRIIVADKQNGGVSSARNAGLDIASGKFVMFCDSDDWAAPTWCSTMASKFQKDNLLMCQFLEWHDGDEIEEEVDNGTETIERRAFLKLYSEGIGSPTTKIYDFSVIAENNLRFPEELFLGEDLVFNALYICAIHGEIKYLQQKLYYYRLSDSISLSKSMPSCHQCEAFYGYLNNAMLTLGTHNEYLWRLLHTIVLRDYEKAFIKIAKTTDINVVQKYRKIKEGMNTKSFSMSCQDGNISNNLVYSYTFKKRIPFLLILYYYFKRIA